MPLLTNSLEGGTSGTTISNANSGGASGDALNTVSIGAGSVLAFDNAHAAHGGLGLKCSSAAGTFSFGYWGTSLGAGQAQVWFRVYLYVTAQPAANNRVVTFWNTTSAGTLCGAVLTNTAGKIIMQNAASTTILTSTNSYPLNQWFRVEGFLLSSATVGQLEFKLFNGLDDPTVLETQTSAASQNTGASVGSIGWGISNSPASAVGPLWLDDFGASTTGYLGPVASTTAAPVQRPVISRRVPLRARIGRLGLCAAGIASTVVTPLGAQQPHKPPVPVTRPAPHRAHVGPLGSAGGGLAGPQPAGAAPVTTAYQRPSPQISRRLPQRAVWRGLASQVVTPRGSRPSPLPRPVIQHPPPDRARLGPAGRPAGGIASPVVTPLGTPGPSWRPQPRRPGPARAAWHGNAGPPAVAPVAAQAYQRPPAQPRGKPTRRGVWHGLAVTVPRGTPARRPGPQITSRPRTRALWRGIAGTIAPPVTALPGWRPLPSRRKPQRAVTGGVRGLANALPPVLQNAASSPVVTAGDTSTASATGAVHGASVAAQGTSAAAVTDPRDGASSVTPGASSTPSASDG